MKVGSSKAFDTVIVLEWLDEEVDSPLLTEASVYVCFVTIFRT